MASALKQECIVSNITRITNGNSKAMANSNTKLFQTTNLKKSGVSPFNYMSDNYFAFDYYVMRHFTEHVNARTHTNYPNL